MWTVNRTDKKALKYSYSTALVILLGGCAWVSFRAGRHFQEHLSNSRRPSGAPRGSTLNKSGRPINNGTWEEDNNNNNNGRLCAADFMGATTCSVPEAASVRKGGGLHLLVDITNVNAEFLNSEKRLARAMGELIERTNDVEMLSHHCQGLAPTGVSCVALLNPGTTATLHTWPAEGVLSMSIYLTTDTLPTLESVRALFGIPSARDGGHASESRIVWAQKYRGFAEVSSGADLPLQLGTMDDELERVAKVESPIQTIDIVDLTTSRFGGDDATSGKQQDRIVYLDGILESRHFGDSAHHEALVHPALFAHDNPHRVVIVGGGEGATLREVLKHKTVKEAIIVEIDELMVKTSRQYLPEWSDCSVLEGSTVSCFDDPRVKLFFEDANVWFIDRFGGDSHVANEDQFDVIILDTVNQSINASLAGLLSDALGDSGILVMQLGMGYSFITENPHLVDDLAEVGFQSIVSYEGSGGRFGGPWGFALAMKDRATRSNWFRNSAAVDLQIHQRTLRTKKSALPFRFFDGAAMMKYQAPSRQLENVWCQLFPQKCSIPKWSITERAIVSVSALEVKSSVIAKGGRGVFAKQFIPKGSIVALDDCVHGMHIHNTTYELMEDTKERFGGASKFWSAVLDAYIEGYGFCSDWSYDSMAVVVDPGIMTFANHGCNGTYNVGIKLNETEATLDFGDGPTALHANDEEEDSNVFNPFLERHFAIEECADYAALRDIEAGEELLDNYIFFGGLDPGFFEENLAELKQLCSGGAGMVFEYDEQSRNSTTQ